ncbi:hypothetical protein SERLA73DRAFT_158166 [Serpula lacrymans var. lacrymans S7.3]|uniref:Uncharacterized protein n=1 Tax=Serpula lacrymans var. lacrymans (strain S7.3) TaxID=936435 RepID=F8PKM7_SERL3|nr:hypothetical protein SERLA73DRAFT_158166 [Serpula lacrymans var. lacrymans S7.3]
MCMNPTPVKARGLEWLSQNGRQRTKRNENNATARITRTGDKRLNAYDKKEDDNESYCILKREWGLWEYIPPHMALFSGDAFLPSFRRSYKTRSRSRKQTSESKTLCIIPEVSEEDEPRPSTSSLPASPAPAPTRQHSTRSLPRKTDARVTLSAYTFSIDDALLLISDQNEVAQTQTDCDSPDSFSLAFDFPRPPFLSSVASSSASSASSSYSSDSPRSMSTGLPTTPATSDDEDGEHVHVRGPRLVAPIRPLCITKSKGSDVKSEVVQIEQMENDDGEVERTQAEEDVEDYEFYTRQFQDIITLSSPLPPSFPSTSTSSSASSRPDSFIRPRSAILSSPQEPALADSKRQGRSRMSKPLPSIPIPSPPSPFLPPALPPSFSLSQRPRRKRVIPPMPLRPPPPPPMGASSPSRSPACLDLDRAPPRMSIPADIFFDDFESDDLSNEDEVEIRVELACDEGEIGVAYSDEQDEDVYGIHLSNRQQDGYERELEPAFPETPTHDMYVQAYSPELVSDVSPRSSIDSEVRTSCESYSPQASDHADSSQNHEDYSTDSHILDEDNYEPSPALRSRWSSSTLASLEQTHERSSHASHAKSPSLTLAFGAAKLKGVFGSRKSGKEIPRTQLKIALSRALASLTPFPPFPSFLQLLPLACFLYPSHPHKDREKAQEPEQHLNNLFFLYQRLRE